MHRGIVLKSFFTTFAILLENGRVAEWLGRALQKLVQRFESARDLQFTCMPVLLPAFFMSHKLVGMVVTLSVSTIGYRKV